jgi:NADH dehydrogenase
MSAMNISLIGGSGFVGRHLIRRLVDQGHQLKILSRHPQRHREILLSPNVKMVKADPSDLSTLSREFQGMDAVINLAGILNEPKHNGAGFHKVHVELPARITQAAKSAQVLRLLHVSALNASSDAPSFYLRSKADGETRIKAAAEYGAEVTLFRPSVLFGFDDQFTNRFKKLMEMIPMVFPLPGARARLQPLYVEDLVTAIASSLSKNETFGQDYNLCGPNRYFLHEIVSYIAAQSGLERTILPFSSRAERFQARMMEWVPGKPFTRDNLASLGVNSICKTPFPEEFGISPTPLEQVAPVWLSPHADQYDEYRSLARR